MWNRFKYEVLKKAMCRVLGHHINCCNGGDMYGYQDPYWHWMCRRCLGIWMYTFPCRACNSCLRGKGRRRVEG